MCHNGKSGWRRPLISGALIPCLVLFTTGCESIRDNTLTGRLWDDSGINRRVPAANPNLRFFRRPDNRDVLVTYDELRERNDAVHRRAFFLKANIRRLEEGEKPRFVAVTVIEKSKLIPVAECPATNAPSAEIICAVVSTDGQEFTVFWAGREIGSYHLPVYLDRTDSASRIALTPLTVTGDIVIAAAIAAVVGGLLVLWAYAEGHSEHR